MFDKSTVHLKEMHLEYRYSQTPDPPLILDEGHQTSANAAEYPKSSGSIQRHGLHFSCWWIQHYSSPLMYEEALKIEHFEAMQK